MSAISYQKWPLPKKEIRRSITREIRVGFPPIIRSKILSLLFEQCYDLSPFTSLKLVSGNGSMDLYRRLVTGEVDFSLLGSLHPLDHPKLVTKELYQKPFYVLLSDQHPLAQKSALSFQELLEEKFILLDEGHTHTEVFNRLNQRYQYQAQIFFQLSDPTMIGQLVKENLGVSLLTEFALLAQLDGLRMIPLVEEEQMSFHVSYAYPKDAVLAPELEQLIVTLESLRDEI